MSPNTSDLAIIREKNINKLLEELGDTKEHESRHYFIRTVINVRCAEMIACACTKLEKSSDANNDISNRLSNGLFFLNVIIASATIIFAILGLAFLFAK
jgi:hypothetical protein